MKIDRLVSILLLLIKRDRVTAPELANYFETSIRTIYRDMDTLTMAGIPIVSEQGMGGGYSIMPGFVLDKQVFKVDELLALMAGLKGMEAVVGGDTLRQTVEKVSHLAPQAQEPSMEIDFFGWDGENRIRHNVQLLHQAVGGHHLVEFQYTNLHKQSSLRQVEPYKLFFRGSQWYTMGYCTLRQDYRFFKVARMENLQRVNRVFTPREGWSEVWETMKTMPRERPATELVLQILPGGEAKAREFFSQSNLTKQEDGSFILRVSFPVDEWVYSYLLGFGEFLRVLEPEDLRKELIRRSGQFLKNNS